MNGSGDVTLAQEENALGSDHVAAVQLSELKDLLYGTILVYIFNMWSLRSGS